MIRRNTLSALYIQSNPIQCVLMGAGSPLCPHHTQHYDYIQTGTLQYLHQLLATKTQQFTNTILQQQTHILWKSLNALLINVAMTATLSAQSTKTWCKGMLTEADTSTIRLDATPSGLTSATSTIPLFFYRPDDLPATQPTVSEH